MCRQLPRAVGVSAVIAAVAACVAMAGCAGSAQRLPECRGKAVPINVRAQVDAAAGSTGQASDAH
jgi:predicted component of type VI protein secretion system